MPDTIQTLAAKQNGYPLLFNGYMARFAKLVKDYVDAVSGTPSHSVKFAGTFSTTAGSSTQTQTLTGATTSDIVIATLKTKGVTPRVIEVSRISSANTLQVIFDGDPASDHVVSYVVLRAN